MRPLAAAKRVKSSGTAAPVVEVYADQRVLLLIWAHSETTSPFDAVLGEGEKTCRRRRRDQTSLGEQGIGATWRRTVTFVFSATWTRSPTRWVDIFGPRRWTPAPWSDPFRHRAQACPGPGLADWRADRETRTGPCASRSPMGRWITAGGPARPTPPAHACAAAGRRHDGPGGSGARLRPWASGGPRRWRPRGSSPAPERWSFPINRAYTAGRSR